MLDGHFGHVGDRDLIAPLKRGGGDLLDRHGLADRRDAFAQGREGQRQALIAGGRVIDATALGDALGLVGELEGHKLSPRERQGLVGDIAFDVSLKLTGLIDGHLVIPV